MNRQLFLRELPLGNGMALALKGVNHANYLHRQEHFWNRMVNPCY